MKKILAFNGSPNVKGNTALLLETMLKAAASKGAETKLVSLNTLKMKGCQACYACQGNGGHCATVDELQPLLEEIYKADAVILGSPVYMGQMSAQLKGLVDRFFSFLNMAAGHKTNLASGKKAVMLFVQNMPAPEAFSSYFEESRQAVESIGFEVAELMVAPGLGGPGAVREKPELLAKAEEIGKKIAQ